MQNFPSLTSHKSPRFYNFFFLFFTPHLKEEAHYIADTVGRMFPLYVDNPWRYLTDILGKDSS